MSTTPSDGRCSYNTPILINSSPPPSELRSAPSPTCQEPALEVDDRQTIIPSPSGEYPACMLVHLSPQRIDEIMQKFCGRVKVRGVSGGLFNTWQSLYPELRQYDSHIIYEYDPYTSRLMIKSRTTAILRSVCIFFSSRFSGVLLSQLLVDDFRALVQISSRTSRSHYPSHFCIC